jgi:hypothetical protein
MAARFGFCAAIVLGWGLWLCAVGAAQAQEATLRPIPAPECQKFATQLQAALGFTMTAGEDDFTDLTDGSDGRSCHISGSASDQTYAAPADLARKMAAAFSDWKQDPARAADAPSGTEMGLVSGSRIATIEVNWEPGPGAICSDKEPLSACKILPQQKLWNTVVDIVEKGGK